MNDHNIDRLFKNKLDNYKAIPSGKVWDGIQSQLPQKNRFVQYKKQIAAAVLLLLIAVSGYFVWNSERKSAPVAPNRSVVSRNENMSIKTPEPEKQSNTAAANPYNAERKTTTQKYKDNKIFASGNTSFETVESEKREMVATGANLSWKQALNDEREKFLTISLAEQKGISGIFPENGSPIPQRNIENKIMPYVKNRQPLHGWAGPAGSIDMIYYPQSRDKLSYAAGAELGLIYKNFYLTSGVVYRSIDEEGLYQINFKSKDSVGYYNKVISFEVDPQNPEQITYKTVKATVYDSIVHVNAVNPVFHYQYISIPLSVGYKFYNHNGLCLALETGVLFSKPVSSKIPDVTFTNPDATLISVTRMTPERVDLNWQWTLSFRAEFLFNKNVSLVLQPTYTKYLNNIYISGSPVKPFTTGLKAGIFFKF